MDNNNNTDLLEIKKTCDRIYNYTSEYIWPAIAMMDTDRNWDGTLRSKNYKEKDFKAFIDYLNGERKKLADIKSQNDNIRSTIRGIDETIDKINKVWMKNLPRS